MRKLVANITVDPQDKGSTVIFATNLGQVHANEGLYPKRTPFAGALEAFVRFGSPYAHRARSKRICYFVGR